MLRLILKEPKDVCDYIVCLSPYEIGSINYSQCDDPYYEELGEVTHKSSALAIIVDAFVDKEVQARQEE